MNAVDHVLVVFEDSAAARCALRDAAAIADEHHARLSVVTLINYERRSLGCCLRTGYWNRVLDEVALAELGAAREILGERDPAPDFEIVPGSGPDAVRMIVDRKRCDLVLLPVHGWFGQRSIRRVRRGVPAEVVGVRAA